MCRQSRTGHRATGVESNCSALLQSNSAQQQHAADGPLCGPPLMLNVRWVQRYAVAMGAAEMRLRSLYSFKTRVGTFYIAMLADGGYHPVFEGNSLGSYDAAFAAAEELAGGHTFSATGIADITTLGKPADLAEWTRLGEAS